jgi:hypothetical protein
MLGGLSTTEKYTSNYRLIIVLTTACRFGSLFHKHNKKNPVKKIDEGFVRAFSEDKAR